MKKRPTPLEMLMAEQRRVRECCRLQEQKINEDFKFIHRHSGRILATGVSSLFFSNRAGQIDRQEPEEKGGQIPFIGTMLKNFSPLLWEAALPILVRWGMRKIGNLFF